MIWQPTSTRDIDLLDKQSRIKILLDEFQSEIPAPASDLPLPIQELLGFVHRNLFDPTLSVATACHNCRHRNHNISTRFRYSVGMGIKNYIETGRVEAAKRLISQLELEIYLVAMSVGYEHPETFCRAFSRQTGYTPSLWRSHLLGGNDPMNAWLSEDVE